MDQFEHLLGIAALAVFAFAGLAAVGTIVLTIAGDAYRILAALRGEPISPAAPIAPHAMAFHPQRCGDGAAVAPTIQVR